MITINFTPNLRRHVQVPTARVNGNTVYEILHSYFQENPQVKSYILDDQGAVRHHVAIFLNQELIHDRKKLSDPVNENDNLFIAQALSGG